MLIRYKKNFEKIAMGLLSFMPDEKDVKKLQNTIKEYESNPSWHLYLWREDDVLGTIGIQILDDNHAVIKHISVNPSYRNLGIGKKMINEIKKMYEEKYTVTAGEFVQQFFDICVNNDEETEE